MRRILSFGVGSLITIGAAFLVVTLAYILIFSVDPDLSLDAAFGILTTTFVGAFSVTGFTLLFRVRKGEDVATILHIVISLAVTALVACAAAASTLHFAPGMDSLPSFCILVGATIGAAAATSIVLARRSAK